MCFFEIFKRFIFGLLRPFCHFEPLQKGEKSTKIKRKLAILGYFACAQYDKFGLLSKNDRQRKCTLPFENDGGFCHFERSDPTGCKAQAAAKKSTKIKRKLTIFGYFACAQYDKIYDTKSVWYDKTNRYDKFRLSPKFFETKEKFKEFKEFAIFFKKNFIRTAKTTLCVAGLCYNELV